LWPVFITVFLAELGDKTQLATVLFAAEGTSRFGIFLAASSALVLSTLLAVLIGAQLAHYLAPNTLKLIAGAGFVVIGVWAMVDAFR